MLFRERSGKPFVLRYDGRCASASSEKLNYLKTQRWRSGKHFVLRYDERCASAHSEKLNYFKTQRWRSGRTRTTRNRVTGNCTGVRIPLSAPIKGTQVEHLRSFGNYGVMQ